MNLLSATSMASAFRSVGLEKDRWVLVKFPFSSVTGVAHRLLYSLVPLLPPPPLPPPHDSPERYTYACRAKFKSHPSAERK
jgi:hypothetical protein